MIFSACGVHYIASVGAVPVVILSAACAHRGAFCVCISFVDAAALIVPFFLPEK